MSLRSSPQLSSELLDAARSNGRRSHGPRSAAGKQHCKMNALKHGERSDPEHHFEVMRALGEDPARFEALKQELRESFGAGDGLVRKQVDDLTLLYWRRERLERMQGGLMRRARLAVEEAQHRRRQAIEGATFEPGQALNSDFVEPSDPAARLCLRRSFLGLIREQVRVRSFLPWQGAVMEVSYNRKSGWRAARLCTLLKEFAARASQRAEEQARQQQAEAERAAWALWCSAENLGAPALDSENAGAADPAAEMGGADVSQCDMSAPPREDACIPPTTGGADVSQCDMSAPVSEGAEIPPRNGGTDAPPRAEVAEVAPSPPDAAALSDAELLEKLQYRELVALLEVEIARAEQEFEYEEKLNEERVAIERDACLAPAGEEWRMMLRREEALERAIDRKIKLLLTLRKESAAWPAAELRSALAEDQKPQTLESRSAPAQEVPAPDEDVGAPASEVLVPLAGAQSGQSGAGSHTGPDGDAAPTSEQPSPEGRGCQAPALSSAGA